MSIGYEALPILPLRGVVVYPNTAVPLTVGQARSIRLVNDVVDGDKLVGLIAVLDPEKETPGPDELYQVGTIATIHRLLRAPDGTVRLLVQGMKRFRLGEFVADEPYFKAHVHLLPEVEENNIETEVLARNARDQFQQINQMTPSLPEELIDSIISLEDPLQTAYTIANFQRIELKDAQEILELDSAYEKLKKLDGLLVHEVEVLHLMTLSYEHLVERAKLIRPIHRLEGHTGSVLSVSFSPDRHMLASGSEDNTVRLWDVQSGREARRLEGHEGIVWNVALSPDGRWLVSGSADDTVRLWEVESGQEVRRIEGHADTVYSVAFSPDGKWLASGSQDNTVRLWEVETGQEVRRMQGHRDTVYSVAFSPDGLRLASGSDDNTVRLWDAKSGQEIRRMEGHTDTVYSVAFSPDGKWLASGSWDKTVRLWEVETGQEVRCIAGHTSWVESVSFSPDGRWLASGGGDKVVRLWQTASGREVFHLDIGATIYFGLSFSPDGLLFAVGDASNFIHLWDISSLECGIAPVIEVPKPLVSIPQVQPHLYAHLRTLPLAHIQPRDLPPERLTSWLRGAGAAGWHLPLGLAHDLGCLLSGAGDQIRKPEHLPYDLDTLGYQSFLERVARYPLVREVSRWTVKPSDAVLGVVLARLVEGLELPAEYGIPAGPEGVRFLKLLAQEIGKQPPSEVWKNTKLEIRPEWSGILPAQKLTRIEANLARLDRQELRFLTQYGVPMGGAPDPRDLLDLLALTNLPEGVRAAMGQTLKLLPRVAEVSMVGGAQIYPEGGYEGLARKGSLDSLLPSELAYGEEMFLYRVLNNEALYYGRERQRDVRRELVYIVTQVGCGMGGDGDILARAVLLALGQALGKRGYEVQYSFAGKELSIPRELQKPGEVARVLYYQDRGSAEPAETLTGVLHQVRKWRGVYRSRQVVWVLGEHFGEDEMKELAGDWKQLRMEAGQQAWFVRMGGDGARKNVPASAQYMEKWQGLWTGILWEGQEGYMVEMPAPKPVKPKKHERSLDEWRMLAGQIKTVHVLKGHTGDITNLGARLPGDVYDFGCSATAEGIIAAGLDRGGFYPDSINGGVMPKDVADNISSDNPLVTSQIGEEGKTISGHIEDFWAGYDSATPDPWKTNGWAQHTWDSVGDFMYTEQYPAGNVDEDTQLNTLASSTKKTASDPNLENHATLGVAFSPDERWLVTGSSDYTVRLWDVQSGQEVRRMEGHTKAVNSVAFSPDGRWLASGSSDNTLRLWEVQSGQEVRRMEGHTKAVNSVAFSPDGRWLVSASSDNTVRLWDVQSGQQFRCMEGHTKTVKGVAFSPDGRWLASGSGDNTVRLWEVQSAREVCRMEGHAKAVNSVAFSLDGRWLASGSSDRTVRLWDVQSSQELRRMEGYTKTVNSVIFSPDGRWLVSGFSDNTLRLWEVQSCQEICRLKGHTKAVNSVAVSLDGCWLASCSNDDTTRLWDVSMLKGE